MLDKHLFKKKIEELLMAFPFWSLNVEDANVMRFWYSKFENEEDKRFVHMVDKYIENETFAPTIKGLKNYDTLPRKSYEQLQHEKAMAEQQRLLAEERKQKQ